MAYGFKGPISLGTLAVTISGLLGISALFSGGKPSDASIEPAAKAPPAAEAVSPVTQPATEHKQESYFDSNVPKRFAALMINGRRLDAHIFEMELLTKELNQPNLTPNAKEHYLGLLLDLQMQLNGSGLGEIAITTSNKDGSVTYGLEFTPAGKVVVPPEFANIKIGNNTVSGLVWILEVIVADINAGNIDLEQAIGRVEDIYRLLIDSGTAEKIHIKRLGKDNGHNVYILDIDFSPPAEPKEKAEPKGGEGGRKRVLPLKERDIIRLASASPISR